MKAEMWKQGNTLPDGTTKRVAMRDLLRLVEAVAPPGSPVWPEPPPPLYEPWAVRANIQGRIYRITTALTVEIVVADTITIDQSCLVMVPLLKLMQSHMALEASERIREGNLATLLDALYTASTERDEARRVARQWHGAYRLLLRYTQLLLDGANKAGTFCAIHGADYFKGQRQALGNLPGWLRVAILGGDMT